MISEISESEVSVISSIKESTAIISATPLTFGIIVNIRKFSAIKSFINSSVSGVASVLK